jgi:hypothetical protein
MSVRLTFVRLRFVLVLLGAFGLVGYWDVLSNYWARLRHTPSDPDNSVSLDTEYWCPMCPGVLSDWPGKCPVCNMALVRRTRQEAVPLPDGVVARMQLSPYRVHLAGIRTYPVEYRSLEHEVVLAGFVEPAAEPPGGSTARPSVSVPVDVFAKDIALVTVGRAVEAVSEAFPGQTFAGKVSRLAEQFTPGTRTLRAWLEMENPQQALRPGMFVTARVRVPVAHLDWHAQAWSEEWRNRTLADLLAHGLFAPGRQTECGLEPLLRMATQRVLLRQGLVLAVPESAVVDTGARKVVFVERMPGMFDGIEVVLGRRSGEFYPLIRGLQAGDRVVTAGAFLLDAETRLNPSVAASYFGAGRTSGKAAAAGTTGGQGAAELSAADRVLAAQQKLCPVTGQPLDSMGGPVKVIVAGRTVFLCCAGCEPALRKNPEKYFSKLDGR